MSSIRKCLFVIVLLFFYCCVYSQEFSLNNFKKVVRIGIYCPTQVTFHTKLITDIGKEYIELNKHFNLNDSLIKGSNVNRLPLDNSDSLIITNNKKSFDTSNFLEFVFSSSATLLNMMVNQFNTNPVNFKNDTIFISFCKTADISSENYKKFIQSDMLDYAVALSNFRSEIFQKYFRIKFIVTIYSKNKGEEKKEMIVDYLIKEEESGNPFFQCDKPLDCIISNFSNLDILIIKKLKMDGYLKRQQRL